MFPYDRPGRATTIRWIVLAGSVLGSLGAWAALPQTGGSREGDFLAWGAGARALGLGKAYVALATDATAAYWNPAGLAFVDRAEGTALHAALWEGTQYDFVGVAMPTVAAGSIGWFGSFLNTGGLERRDRENNVMPGDFGVKKFGSGLAYGMEIRPGMSAGVTLKWLGRWLDGEASGFLTADLGWRYVAAGWMTIGAVFQHVAGASYGDTNDVLGRLGRLGVVLNLCPEWGLVVGDVEWGMDGAPSRWRVGMESVPLGPLTVRVGLDTWEMAGGLGVRYEDLSLDYGGGWHAELGLSHRFSVGCQWGASNISTRALRAREAFERALVAYERWEKTGGSPEESPSAREEVRHALEEVLVYDPRNQAALKLLERLAMPSVNR